MGVVGISGAAGGWGAALRWQAVASSIAIRPMVVSRWRFIFVELLYCCVVELLFCCIAMIGL